MLDYKGDRLDYGEMLFPSRRDTGWQKRLQRLTRWT